MPSGEGTRPKVQISRDDFEYDDDLTTSYAYANFLGAVVLQQMIGVIQKLKNEQAGVYADAARCAGWIEYLGIAEGISAERLIAECRAVLG